jgi:hypothetical protein
MTVGLQSAFCAAVSKSEQQKKRGDSSSTINNKPVSPISPKSPSENGAESGRTSDKAVKIALFYFN